MLCIHVLAILWHAGASAVEKLASHSSKGMQRKMVELARVQTPFRLEKEVRRVPREPGEPWGMFRRRGIVADVEKNLQETQLAILSAASEMQYVRLATWVMNPHWLADAIVALSDRPRRALRELEPWWAWMGHSNLVEENGRLV